MAPRPRCPTCGSRQWHKEPSSGLIACNEGHILQSYRNEATEAEDLGFHALKKRVLKSHKERKGADERSNLRLYHGARSHYLYFQCLQLLLRHQVSALRMLWSLPPEFESMCRDIWALYLSSLPNPPPPEPFLHVQHRQMNDQADEHPGFRPPTPQSDAPFDPHVGLANDSGYGHDLSGSEGDPELDALLRENSEIDSSSSEEGEVTNAPNPKTKRYRTSWFESPTCTLAILVVSCWILRIPILYCDLVKEIEIYRIPYLDALRLLPENMISHLNKYCVMTLSPHFAPTVIQMHRYSSRLAKVMFKVFGVMTPEANAAPILWRCVRSTGGTPIVYCIAKELARILSVPMALHHSLTPKLQRKRANDPERRVHDNIPPELSLQCCVLIVLKMMYGFDGHARLPTDSSDPVNLLPGIEEFLSLLREDEDEKDAFHSRNASMIVGDLDSHQLDAYLDFCERVLLQEGIEPDAEISRYFPLTQNNVPEWGTSSKNKPEKITAKAPGTSALSPGAGYQMYHGRDILGTFPEEYGIVLERAGRNVGVEVGYVNGVMETYERRLMAWWQMEKRQVGGNK